MRVLWLQSSANIGGIEITNFRIWCHLRDAIDFQVGFLDEPGPITDLYEMQGHETFHLRFHERPIFAVVRDLYRLLRRTNFDVIHIFGLRANLLARPLAHFFTSARIVTGQQNTDAWRRPYHNWLDRLTSRWVDVYLANCHAVASWLRQTVHLSSQKVHVIYTGVNTDAFNKEADGQLRLDFGIPSTALIISAVANLRRSKAHETLLDAFRQLGVDDQVQPHLFLIGTGHKEGQLKQYIDALQLTDRVHLLGERSDVSVILADTDIKVLSSDWEGLPGAIMEAMAAGLPVVATAVGGVPELVIEGETGRLVPPNNPEALATALQTLMQDPAERRRFGNAGRQRIHAHFRLVDSADALLAFYEGLLATS